MAYNPSLYNPYGQQNVYQTQQAMPVMQPVNGIVYINDLEGAKGYQMPPNSVSPPLVGQSAAA